MNVFKTVILKNGVFQLQDGSLWIKDKQLFPWCYVVEASGQRPAYTVCIGWVDRTSEVEVLGEQVWQGMFYSILLPTNISLLPNPIELNYDDFEIKVPLRPMVVLSAQG
jgi:hypothetical protein